MTKFKDYIVTTITGSANFYSTIIGCTQYEELIAAPTAISGSMVRKIGFDFVFNGIAYDSFKAFSTGFIQLVNSHTLNSTYDADIDTINTADLLYSRTKNIRAPIIAPWLGRLKVADSGGGIQTGLFGDKGIGGRKRIVDFDCYERYDHDETDNTTISFQIILHENQNHIEYVYGMATKNGSPSTSLGASAGVAFGNEFRNVYDSDYKFGGSIVTQTTNLKSETSTWPSNTTIKIKPSKTKTKLALQRQSQFLQTLDSDPYQYPLLISPGDQDRSTQITSTFNDRNTMIFGVNTPISYPLGIPEGHPGLDPKAAAITINRIATKGVADSKQYVTYLSHSIPTVMPPFKDVNLYEEQITDKYFTTGSRIQDVGFGFNAPLKSKIKINLSFPIATQTLLPPTTSSITYYNTATSTFEIISEGTVTPPGSMEAASSGDVNGTYDAITVQGVIGAGHDCRLFNAFGVPVNSGSYGPRSGSAELGMVYTSKHGGNGIHPRYPGAQYSYYVNPADSGEPGIYSYQLNNPLYSASLGTFKNEGFIRGSSSGSLEQLTTVTKSLLTDSAFAASDTQKIHISSSINAPFLLEKAVIKLPITAGPGWLNDKTRALHAGFDFRSFDIGGPAVTVSLLRQDKDNLRELILSGTIIPQDDNTSKIVQGVHETFYNQQITNIKTAYDGWDEGLNSYTTSPAFYSRTDNGFEGFKTFGTPSCVVSAVSGSTFTGSVVLNIIPGTVNGVYSLTSQTKGEITSSCVGFKNSRIFQVSNFGKSLDGKPSGRNLTGGEFNIPSRNNMEESGSFAVRYKISQASGSSITDGLMHAPTNYFRFENDAGDADGINDTIRDFMSGSGTALNTSGSNTGNSPRIAASLSPFTWTVSDSTAILFTSSSCDALQSTGTRMFHLFTDADDHNDHRSISMFVKMAEAPDTDNVVLLSHDNGTAGWKLEVQASTGYVDFRARLSSTHTLIETSGASNNIRNKSITDGNWHHIALTITTFGVVGTTAVQIKDVNLYIDGEKYSDESGATTNSWHGASNTFVTDSSTSIKARVAAGHAGQYWQGYMSDLAYWATTKLTDSEVLTIYSASLEGKPLYKTSRGSSQVYQYLEFVNSPYLLMPQDKLILAVSKTRPVRTTPNQDHKHLLTGSHEFYIATGSAHVTLYGSLVQQHKQHFHGLNQYLSSNAIHHVIGNEPVLDQYDVEKAIMLSGSYIDNIITGSMVTVTKSPKGIAYTSVTAGTQRKIIGSNFDPDVAKLKRNITGSNGMHLKRRRPGEVKRNNKNITLTTVGERYYDTLMPSWENILKINDVNILVYTVRSGLGFMFLNYRSGSLSTTYGVGQLNTWQHEFPFESKYSSIKRTPDVVSTMIGRGHSSIASSGGSQIRAKINTLRLYSDVYTGSTTGQWGDGQSGGYGIDLNSITHRNEIIKILFGTGDHNGYLTDNSTTRGNTNMPNAYAVFPEGQELPVIIRGWKYGILNGAPQNSNAIFRRDQYGQFRDMLEQRKDSKFYRNSINSKKNDVSDSPIFIRFV
ncbi:hypothetical protein CL622_09160, partial [archaeon]|nr:hypothetical protein [archaeon]